MNWGFISVCLVIFSCYGRMCYKFYDLARTELVIGGERFLRNRGTGRIGLPEQSRKREVDSFQEAVSPWSAGCISMSASDSPDKVDNGIAQP